MIADNYLARIFAWTVCLISTLIAVAITWQVIVQRQGVDIDLKEIAFLLFGGLLGRLTTQKHPEAGDSAIPVTTAPGDVVATTDTSASSADPEIHDDAPASSDL